MGTGDPKIVHHFSRADTRNDESAWLSVTFGRTITGGTDDWVVYLIRWHKCRVIQAEFLCLIVDSKLQPVSLRKFGQDVDERTWAVIHSLVKLNRSLPPNPRPVARTVSPSLAFLLNHPIVSSFSRAMRISSPLSHVANARPSCICDTDFLNGLPNLASVIV